MSKDKLAWLGMAAAACMALALSNCATTQGGAGIQDGTPVPGAIGRVVNLDQGWSETDQQWFWFTSQGSRIIRYEWFMALEQPSGTSSPAELFRADANMERFRFLTAKRSSLNPDGLPVGFARDSDETGRHWVGWTCAACHTGQVEYKGTALRIDGGPMMADPTTFQNELLQAMRQTNDDDVRFERFAHQVLGKGYSQEAANALRRDLFDRTEQLAQRFTSDAPRHPYGNGRLDAFGAIFNQVLGSDLNLPGNYALANAPVSVPFLWDTPHLDLVQWNGIGFNDKGIGPLARNVGEILGVFGTVEVEKGKVGYKSSARIIALGDLEKTLNKLWSPLWPMEYLPALDPVKAEKGGELYRQHCASCHSLIQRTDPNREISVVMTPVTEVGTDPTMADNFVNRTASSGILEGERAFVLAGDLLTPTAKGADILDRVVIGAILDHPSESLKAGIDEYARVKAARKFQPESYKARPLDGIWATAPYLHNGSVPNLWQLLQPAEQRIKKFHLGSRAFDPVNVGFDTSPSPVGFDLDTTLPGNSNSGHLYGTKLTDAEKWELIEFMKSL